MAKTPPGEDVPPALPPSCEAGSGTSIVKTSSSASPNTSSRFPMSEVGPGTGADRAEQRAGQPGDQAEERVDQRQPGHVRRP